MPARSLLAFDYGLKHIGVAQGQTVTQTASPLCVLKAKDGQPNWQQVEQLLTEWQPDLVIVGLPLNMDGSPSEMSARANKFANRVHGRFGVAVETIDERLSSYEAKGQVIERSGQRNFGQQTVDAIAAQLILQSWFNKQG
ncbi:putative Holliday junction resolvase [Sinobacterium caligoides]|uniref:Putative pre-16S rRNA nuclease n=1 Tax=Sinobacterium caligoides TaxID=933926 RepID=A0A3N2DGK1_9GAMM|nr:Holliday junction resolvase RuvX [Sinobacterium caligoides]ROR98926.1 putative Holliday junction resolvase [Sinobacterium caligoides]